MTNELIVSNNAAQIVQGADGKFKRKAEYKVFSSVNPESREQKVEMFNLLNSGEEDGLAAGFRTVIGKEFKIADVITNPYESVDEDTGEIINGVLVFVSDQEGNWYVTSSKSAYFTLVQNLFRVFNEPHWNEEEAPLVRVVEKKGQNHKYVDLKLIG